MYFVAKPNEEAKAFIQAAGLIDETQCRAVGTLVIDLKNYNIWDKMKAIYPMVGQADVSSSFQFNLKNPTLFKGTFSGSWSYASTGITGDGSSAYMDTNFIPSIHFTGLNNKTFGVYIGTNVAGGTDIGSLNSSFSGDQIITRLNTNIYGSSNSGGSTSYPSNPYSDSRGFWVSSRLSSTNFSFYRNGVNLETGDPSITQHNLSIFIGTRRVGNIPDAGQYTTKRFQFAFLGDGLTDTEAANFYTAVQRFQTTLGRQV